MELKKNETDEPTCKAETDTDIEIKRMDTKTGKGKWDELGDWDSMHTLLCME